MGQGRRVEHRIAAQCAQDDLAQCLGFRRFLGNLQILLRQRRLRAGGHIPVHPFCFGKRLAKMVHLFAAQDGRDV